MKHADILAEQTSDDSPSFLGATNSEDERTAFGRALRKEGGDAAHRSDAIEPLAYVIAAIYALTWIPMIANFLNFLE